VPKLLCKITLTFWVRTWETFYFWGVLCERKIDGKFKLSLATGSKHLQRYKNPNFKYTKPLLSFVHYENT
jgi:hypothetical protein